MSAPAPCGRVEACRACGGRLSIPFCDLGSTPLANAYVRPQQAGEPDAVYPLNAVVCERCLLVQLDHVVDAAHIFSDYAYFSSFSRSWLDHAARFARGAIARFGVGPGSFVAEVASNDGYLLRNFVEAGIPCLGIEPAANVAAAAEASGVPTRVGFFGREAAADIVAERGHADIVVANNVLAHVPDLTDFVAGLAHLAGEAGVVSIEAPHLVSLVDHVQFDTIYHEHYAYWSLHAMERLFSAHGLSAFDVEVLPTHGTSLRVFASRAPRDETDGLRQARALEAERGVASPGFYHGFQPRVASVISAFREHLRAAKGRGARVAAYGAAAKGNTFLNACGVAHPEIEMVADRNPEKQGRLLPGSRIPIVSPEHLIAWEPDEVVVLPWNLAREIAAELAAVTARGGLLLVAIPALRRLEAEP